MKKLLFGNGWVTFGMMLLCSIGDLIFLKNWDFGMGFVLALLYFIGLGFYSINQKKS